MTAIKRFQHTIPTWWSFNRNFRQILFYGSTITLVLLAAILCWLSPVQADAYAVKQISAFAQSRPAAKPIIDEGKGIYQFMEKAFSGIYTSVPLAWDPAEPNDNAYAEHKPSVNRKVINIRVSSILSPLDQVACLVYEAINAQNEDQFTEITEEAHEGVMTKLEFIHNILRLEHKSLKRTLAFLSKEKPYKDIDLSQTIFYSKMSGTPEEFDDFLEYLHRIKRDEYDVFEHYSNFYDFVIPPTRRWKANQKAAAKSSGASSATEKKRQ